MQHTLAMEWIEPDGRGGFASGTVGGVRTRAYHALLLAAASPPVDRFVLVSGLDAWVTIDGTPRRITRHCYAVPDQYQGQILPQDAFPLESFTADPWPRWVFRLAPTLTLEHELFVPHDHPACVLSFRLIGPRPPSLRLFVRPLLAGRDMHAAHHENPAFDFTPHPHPGGQRFAPYAAATPHIAVFTDAAYTHQPDWYRSFLYREEQSRHLACTEDLASPGSYEADLASPANFIFQALPAGTECLLPEPLPQHIEALRAAESRRRHAFRSPLERASDAYIVRRGQHHSIIAGYPWFTDWGRDTFLALRGLCLATQRYDIADSVLTLWSSVIDGGMIPNRFVDHGEPEFHSIDASLWFVIAAGEFLSQAAAHGYAPRSAQHLRDSMLAIVRAYRDGTRFNIGMDELDGLVQGGESGYALTWMDARIGTWCMTPRIGKPVEVQALWIAALEHVKGMESSWSDTLALARLSFEERYFNTHARCLFDVVDVNFQDGLNDPAIRPNQLYALGGLGPSLLPPDRTAQALEIVEQELLTPMGPRSLAPRERDFAPRYFGSVEERDLAYHQGTVWPFLMGPFIEAWVRHRGSTLIAKQQARQRYFEPFLAATRLPGHGAQGIGHIAEIADAQPPHIGRGCPFQAWSLAEALRLDLQVLRP